MKCRHCSAPLVLRLVDLGSAPPSNSYLTRDKLDAPERWYPLAVRVCEACWLVQTELSPPDELFDPTYAYFSAFSSSWLAHCERFVGEAVERFSLGKSSHVVEVAANDGYLLQYVVARGIPCTGIEPTASTAAAARARGISIVEAFFGARLAAVLVEDGKSADLIIANNVLAHVPDISDFVTGVSRLLKPTGVASFEFPHLVNLVREVQFDTIYHEHYSYLSLTAVKTIFERNGLAVVDVEKLPTHGGSLRVFARRSNAGAHAMSERAQACLAEERALGVDTKAFYDGFQAATDRMKDDLLSFLIAGKRAGKRVAAYGAAAKGNTFLNYAGVRPDLLAYVVDRNPMKQGKFMPGSRIPIVDEAHQKEHRPDYVVLLPWNLRRELTEQLAYVRDWGGALVAAPDWKPLS